MLLPAVVLVVTVALGAAASLRLVATSEAPAVRESVASTPEDLALPPAVEPTMPAVAPVPAEPATVALPAAERVAVEPAAVVPSAPEPAAAASVVPVPVVIVPEVVVPEGRAGLVEAIRAGRLRPGSRADLERWLAAARASGQAVDPERLADGVMDVFVIEKDLTVPAGLSGAHAVIFVLDAGKPFPRGDLGHSLVLDVSSGGCIGLTCRMMLSR